MKPARGSEVRAPGIILLVVLSLAWGLNWPAMKLALGEIPPWTFRCYAALIGGALLLAAARLNGHRILPRGREWGHISSLALTNITAFQMLLTLSLLHMASGPAALLAYTMPLWVALIGMGLGDRLQLRVAMALAAGLAGVGLLWAKGGSSAAGSPWAIAAVLVAAFSWALGTQLQMRLRWHLEAIPIAGLQLVLGALPMLPPMIWLEGGWAWAVSLQSWLCWGFMVVAMALGYALWVKLIELTSAQIAAIASLVVPVIGVVSGALVLHEPLGWREIGATVAIVGGLVLVRTGPRNEGRRAGLPACRAGAGETPDGSVDR
jgi:drug/metabolite transporter (DMT)-like permease